jgi:hypothetical protein
MTTALDLLQSSARLANILASGETMTADEANDGLKVFNDILENWSTQNLMVWARANQTFPLTTGVGTYTIGPAGTWNTDRPVRITGGYTTIAGTDFPFTMWGQVEYNAVAVKTISGVPQRALYVADYPLGSVSLYPVPASAISAQTITLTIDRLLTFPLALTTVLAFPPGYEKALRYELAVALGPEYGV